MKGLLPDEEKEKIGPKNVSSSSATRQTATKISSSAVITAKPQTNPQVYFKLYYNDVYYANDYIFC